ncbi:hypothetical protein QCA50_007196 [Cerrena zonata]|uniref:Uncharacterized protein n=1 Tax=Cerrena zonata TaxID=2478898 RepID=A0AAW0GDI1_9APHY
MALLKYPPAERVTSAQTSANQGGQSQEKQDWLDKGIQGAGREAGVNVSNQNADKIGDFANKQVDKKEGE